MKADPFFSVVVPTYNRADLLPKAIESVLKQTYDNWELVIIDDGSTDNTADVVKQFADADMRIHYLYQANAERCVARNNGIDHATGCYICFLDSDDYYLPERLKRLYDELQQQHFPAAMLYTGMTAEHDGKMDLREGSVYTGANIFETILINTIHSQEVCIFKDILQEFKFDSRFTVGEDMELWLRIAAKYPVIYIEKQYDVVVLEHDGRSVNILRTNIGAEQLRLYHYVFTDAHSGKRLSDKVKAYRLASCFHSIARFNIHQGKRWAAAWAIFKAAITDWGSPWTRLRVNTFLKLVTFTDMQKIQRIMDV